MIVDLDWVVNTYQVKFDQVNNRTILTFIYETDTVPTRDGPLTVDRKLEIYYTGEDVEFVFSNGEHETINAFNDFLRRGRESFRLGSYFFITPYGYHRYILSGLGLVFKISPFSIKVVAPSELPPITTTRDSSPLLDLEGLSSRRSQYAEYGPPQ